MKSKSITLLPEEIVQMIQNSELTELAKDKSYNIVNTIIYKTLVAHDREDYTPLWSKYLKLNFGTRYFIEFFEELQRANIIQAKTIEEMDNDKDFKKDYKVGGSSIKYRINPDMLTGCSTHVEFTDRGLEA